MDMTQFRKKVAAQERRRGRALAFTWVRDHGLKAAIFRHRQAVDSWRKAGHKEVPWEAAAFLRGESNVLLRYATSGVCQRGNCYVTCEALYHLLGGKASGWTPATVRHEGDVHWFLRRPRPMFNGIGGGWLVLDPTAKQFKTPVPYEKARGRGFLTREPSARARQMMETMLWQSK